MAVYRVRKAFPREELFGLTSEIRRCCSSIPANIAERCGRESDRDFTRFLQIAMGSACELEYHLLLAHDLNLLGQMDYSGLPGDVTEVKRMLTAFLKKLRADR